MNIDEYWMKIAIEEALKAEKEGEVPVGAVLVEHEKIIAKAYNQPISKNDSTAHAEIQVIRAAGKKLGNYRLNGTTIYVTLEPCAMCLGAIMHARIKRIVYGAKDSKSGVCGSCAELHNASFFNHKIQISEGVLGQECSRILQSFFKTIRQAKLV